MSYKLVDLCFHIPSLKLGEQAVLMAICKHADNKTHDCYPSREVIAKFARLEIRQVQRIVSTLVDKGLITRDSGKGRKPSSYTVQHDHILDLISEDNKTPLQEESDPQPDTRSGDTATPQDVDRSSDITPPLGGNVVGTSTTPVSGHSQHLVGTLATASEDIHDSLYKKNLSGISQGIGQEQSVKARALQEAKSLSLAVNPEASADLSDIAERIAIAHPRNMLKHIGPMEVPQVQLQAIVAAILLEVGKGDMNETEAGEYLLNCVHELVAVVPREEWRFLPPVPLYFTDFEYRGDPTRFVRSTSARGGARNGKRNGHAETERDDKNAAAFRELFSSGPTDGDERVDPVSRGVVQPEADGRGEVRVHGGTGTAGRLAADPGVLAGAGGVPVLSKPSYPPRVQWPTRVR